MGTEQRVCTITRACAAAALAMMGTFGAEASCGSAFCAVDTNWNLQGLAAEQGWRLDLRYEYIDQDQPMSGRHRVAAGQGQGDHDEVKTVNRNYVGTLDYTFDDRWSLALTLPASDRFHAHVDNHDDERIVEEWDYGRVGDMQVVGRYRWMAENTERISLGFYGFNFGLKLPTGEHELRNGSGDVAERTLQPGTGTTDLLVGGYYNRVLPAAGSSWFVQGLWQVPMNSRDHFRPGQRLAFDAGYRYEATGQLGLMLQINAIHRERDSGTQSEPEETGGSFIFLSPGMSYAITRSTQIYAFVQAPLYQYVNGVQLTADWSAVLGISARFP